MKVTTKHFGEIEVQDDQILDFIGGVPGFDGNRYVLLNSSNEENSPFVWLQSLDDTNIALVLLNTFMLYPDYAPDVNDEFLGVLEFENREDLAVFSVMVIPEKMEDMTVNLKAPIIINNKNRKAIQVICDNSNYEIKHKVYDDLQKVVESNK
ncbi:MAG: flagellar assembly protein FliW [Clostridia bacterium]|nr:flagellar assembly protein FliW [Clostridia bacterium]